MIGNWWFSLSSLNQAFFVAAVFFSTIFVWQFFSSLSGLGGEGEADVDMEADVDFEGDFDADGDLLEDNAGLATFRLLSIRSFLAFATLASWAGALYLAEDRSPVMALLLSLAWGMAGMLVVAAFFWFLPKLTEEGNSNLDTAIGQSGQVYVNIPAQGAGQVRVLVSGTISFVKARSQDGTAISAGTPIRVVNRLDSSTLEVVAIESQ